MKKVTIGSKPTAKSAPTSPDEWVSDRAGSDEPTKRLTIDISLSLHQRVKSQCALKGEKMADAVRELLETHFAGGNQEKVKRSDPDSPMQKYDSAIFRKHDDDPTGS